VETTCGSGGGGWATRTSMTSLRETWPRPRKRAPMEADNPVQAARWSRSDKRRNSPRGNDKIFNFFIVRTTITTAVNLQEKDLNTVDQSQST
jgi:hypothetical protein